MGKSLGTRLVCRVLIFMGIYFYRGGVDRCIVVMECVTHDFCATHFGTRCHGSKVINLLAQQSLPCHYRLNRVFIHNIIVSEQTLNEY